MADYIKLTMNKKIEDEKSKKDLSQDGFDFEDETYIKKIELEDDIMVEQYELITTTVEIYVTAIWTNGSQAEVRVSILLNMLRDMKKKLQTKLKPRLKPI